MSYFDAAGDGDRERHSKDDALTQREFEELYHTTYSMKKFWDCETRFILIAAGRLGLRAGEIVHITEDWINWDKQRIEIPAYQHCNDGKDGSYCSLCKQAAEQKYNVAIENIIDDIYDNIDNGILEPAGRRVYDAEFPTYEDALNTMWSPKTDNSARSVPFDFSARVEMVIDHSFDVYDGWSASYQTLKRRIDRVSDMYDYIDSDVYPHCLRATAATYHTNRGLDPANLKSMFGWSLLSTSKKYLSESDANLQRTLRSVHSR